MEPASDRSLLRRYREGSQDAAQELYARYGPRLRALIQAKISREMAQRLEPEDLVQSVFCRFFLKVQEGDYDVPRGEDLWGLFLVLGLNRLRSAETFHRALKRDVRRTVQGELIEYAIGATTPRHAETHEVVQGMLEDVLDRMPPVQRSMLELRIEGHGVAEIAQAVGRSKRSVERCLQDVRRRLRQELEYQVE